MPTSSDDGGEEGLDPEEAVARDLFRLRGSDNLVFVNSRARFGNSTWPHFSTVWPLEVAPPLADGGSWGIRHGSDALRRPWRP